MDWVLQFNDGSAACGTVGNLLTTVLRTEVTLPRLRQIRRVTEQLFALYGEHRGTLTVVERTAISDTPRDVREESAVLMRQYPSLVATVIEGGGFKGVGARAIMSGLALVAGKRDKLKIFASVDEAAEWIAPRVPTTSITAAEVKAAVERTRAALG
jgi:hypothetical protein